MSLRLRLTLWYAGLASVAIIALSLLAIFFAILAAAGVFNGSKTSAPPVTPPVKHVTVTVPASTPANTGPTAVAPSQTLKPGDTGSQVTILQKALIALNFSPGMRYLTGSGRTSKLSSRFQETSLPSRCILGSPL